MCLLFEFVIFKYLKYIFNITYAKYKLDTVDHYYIIMIQHRGTTAVMSYTCDIIVY